VVPRSGSGGEGGGDPFEEWLEALEERHLADLTFQEVRRALQALSSIYVERRGRIRSGGPLDSAGKRAAFALFYGPLHFLLVRGIVRALGAAAPPPARILDLGCGTAAAGAAWALEAGGVPTLTGVDRSGWALDEARWTLRVLGVRGDLRRGDLSRATWSGEEAVLAAFTFNEIEAALRDLLLRRLLDAARRGARVLVVDAVARSATPWWDDWSAAIRAAGGRDDLWRLPVALPERLRRLDRAAGLDHNVLTGRSLWLACRGAPR
jgi:SAM-dependent methyltransferase